MTHAVTEVFPIELVRAEFPSLATQDDGRPRIYLDNPAGTQVAARVADAAAHALIHTNANLGGYFRTSRLAEAVVQRSHEAMARFLNALSFREIVIAQSMTNLTFAIAQSIGRTLSAGDEIILTQMDHDGNIAPWLMLAEDRNLTVRWLPFSTETWVIEPQELRTLISPRTKLLALNYASNLTGSVNDVAALCAIAKEAGAIAYVDAVQYAPHGLIDVQRIGCDLLACSAYKFFGPHLGILWGREALLESLIPYKPRPQTNELPWRFETGTPQIELHAALASAVQYFEWLGSVCGIEGTPRERIAGAFAHFGPWESALAAQLIDGIRQLPGVRICGITDPDRYGRRVPTVSFTAQSRSPHVIAKALADQNIFVWSGNNYALELVRSLGIPPEEGVLRVGVAHYNTPAEIAATIDAVQRAVEAEPD